MVGSTLRCRGTPTTSTSGNTEWANSANWSPNVIPNTNTDVIIPYVKGGQYPTVGSNSNAATNSVHNLRISGKGNDASLGARLFLVGGSLAIFGNFQDINGGLAQSGTGVLYLSGQDQVFDASPSLNNLYIRGGGTKTLTGLITIANRIEFLGAGSGFAAGGILATSISNPNNFGVKLLADAVLAGETEGAYVRGSVNTTRSVTKNVRNTFGGIGLDLKTSADIGNLTVNRTSSIYEGAGTSVSINRGFTLFSSATDLVTTDLTFHYLNDELNDIDPVDLRLFSSETGDIPFVPLGKTSASITNKTLTRLAIKGSLQVTFTLGSVLNPLPVTLTSFTATPTAQGTALLRWATASETDNRGFNIERQLSTDGSWTTVGFVAAGATTGSAYEYVDKSLASAPVSDKVYYRLRQEDLNGKTSYLASGSYQPPGGGGGYRADAEPRASERV